MKTNVFQNSILEPINNRNTYFELNTTHTGNANVTMYIQICIY